MVLLSCQNPQATHPPLDLTPPMHLEGIPKLRYSYTNPVHSSPASVTLRQIILNGQIFGVWMRWVGQWLNGFFLQSAACATWFLQVLLCHGNLLAINRGQLYLLLWRLAPTTTPAPTVMYCLLSSAPLSQLTRLIKPHFKRLG